MSVEHLCFLWWRVKMSYRRVMCFWAFVCASPNCSSMLCSDKDVLALSDGGSLWKKVLQVNDVVRGALMWRQDASPCLKYRRLLKNKENNVKIVWKKATHRRRKENKGKEVEADEERAKEDGGEGSEEKKRMKIIKEDWWYRNKRWPWQLRGILMYVYIYVWS